jgi:hypothetical protein
MRWAALAALAVLAMGGLALAEDGSVEWPVSSVEFAPLVVGGCGYGVLNCWCEGWIQYCWYYYCYPCWPFGCYSPCCNYWIAYAGPCGSPAPVKIDMYLK